MGEEEWSKRFEIPENDFSFNVHQTNDDGYIFTSRKDNADIIFVKVNSQGEEEWTHTVLEGGSGTIEYPSDIEVVSDGYLIAAVNNFIKLDLAGNPVWTKTTDLKINNILPISDGNYLLVSTPDFIGGQHLSKRTPDGAEIWKSTVDDVGGDTRTVQIVELDDGGFLLVDVRNEFGMGIIYNLSLIHI